MSASTESAPSSTLQSFFNSLKQCTLAVTGEGINTEYWYIYSERTVCLTVIDRLGIASLLAVPFISNTLRQHAYVLH